MSIVTIQRLVAGLATAVCLTAAPVAAHTASASASTPAQPVPTGIATAAAPCPDDTFCVRDAGGHYAYYRNGSNNVRAQGLTGPAVWAWNRTQATWCIYSQPNRAGDDAKVDSRSQGRTTFAFYALRPASLGFCV